jgi:hypothetical protein
MSELLMKMPVPYEPKTKNRWLIHFKGDYKDIPIWVVSKTSRPRWASYKTDKYGPMNSDWPVNGDWCNIEIHFRDPISKSTSKILMDAFRMSGKNKKIKYTLEMLDPTGVTVEKWKIKGEVKEVDFGELDYSNDALAEIKMVIKPNKVKLVF